MKARVAFTLVGGRGWMGGYNYLLNLFRAVAKHGGDQLEMILFSGTDLDEGDLRPFLEGGACTVVRNSVFDAARSRRALAWSLLVGRDPGVNSLLDSQGIDLMFEAASFRGWRLGVPAIAWIPDFQHRYLPEFFTTSGWLKREIGFRAQIHSGRAVMVSSNDSRGACEALYPVVADRVRTVRFAVPAPNGMSEKRINAVLAKYELPEKFFLMPNQFWAHKNHRLVVDALKLLAARGLRPVVFASGSQIDPRNPGHFDSLRSSVVEAGLVRQLIMPGLIPAVDLGALMYTCDALINPSLFEGWSTNVEEARSAGTPMILSDLPVHREQAGDSAVFFDPHAPDSLAKALEEHVSLSVPERNVRRDLARQNAEERVRSFALEFIRLVHDCIR